MGHDGRHPVDRDPAGGLAGLPRFRGRDAEQPPHLATGALDLYWISAGRGRTRVSVQVKTRRRVFHKGFRLVDSKPGCMDNTPDFNVAEGPLSYARLCATLIRHI